MIANGQRQNIVVPWNFDNLSRLALNRALEEVENPSFVRVVHVAAPLVGPDNGLLYSAAEKRKCHELELRFQEQVRDDDRTKQVRFSVVFGNVGQEIASFADRCQAKMIVMAPREKTQIYRFLFGSSTAQVDRLASCPVLVLDRLPASRPEKKPQGLINEPASV